MILYTLSNPNIQGGPPALHLVSATDCLKARCWVLLKKTVNTAMRFTSTPFSDVGSYLKMP
jgi:hypothetical protein